MSAIGNALLLVDDHQDVLDELSDALRPLLPEHVEVRSWRPAEGDDVQAVFAAHLEDGVSMVVTDDDLTTGVRGFFGFSIVAWCQQRFVPVGNFSRANKPTLPQEPNLFEIRVPRDNDAAAAHINETFRGFRDIGNWISSNPDQLSQGHRPAQLLSLILGPPSREEQLSPYLAQLGASHAAILDGLRRVESGELPAEDRQRLYVYVLGHVLANSILKYPGPVLHMEALTAYCATEMREAEALAEVFSEARYNGPFALPGRTFWRERIDATLDDLLDAAAAVEQDAVDADQAADIDMGGQRRRALEHLLGRALATHDCERCDGLRGGYWCPLTPRAVCEREDCSVPTSPWIPRGANLSRVERDFFDEWSPLLGY